MCTLGAKFLLPFGVITALFSVFVLGQAYVSSREHVNQLLQQQASLALEFNLAIRDYAATTIRPAMEALLDKDEFIPETMSTSLISRNIFEMVRKRFPEYVIRFASDNPRNPVNLANPDELRLIEHFRQNPAISREIRTIDIDGRGYLAAFEAKKITPDCMHCHGDPKDAPAALVKQYGATASFHRTLGDVAGLDTVAIPLDEVHAALSSEMRWKAATLVSGLALLFGSVIAVFRFVVTRRLSVISQHFHQIAASPVGARMVPVPVTGRDEIGVAAAAFNTLIRHLQTAYASLEQRVTERTALLAQTNEDLKKEILDHQRAQDKLNQQLEELQRWHGVTLGRERRIQALKHEVNELLSRLGEAARYQDPETQGQPPIINEEGKEPDASG